MRVQTNWWDFQVQTENMLMANQPDIEESHFVSIPSDDNIRKKDPEKDHILEPHASETRFVIATQMKPFT